MCENEPVKALMPPQPPEIEGGKGIKLIIFCGTRIETEPPV